VAPLEGFTGALRRFQLKGVKDGVTIVDDYAHHPTELKATLSAARDGDWKRVIAVFQPHLYSRTEFLQAEFAEISPLNHIDQVKIPVLVAYGGSDPVVSVDQSKRLIAELKRQKVPCEVLIKRDEGHGMARLDDQVEYYTMVEKFLARNLAKP